MGASSLILASLIARRELDGQLEEEADPPVDADGSARPDESSDGTR